MKSQESPKFLRKQTEKRAFEKNLSKRRKKLSRKVFFFAAVHTIFCQKLYACMPPGYSQSSFVMHTNYINLTRAAHQSR